MPSAVFAPQGVAPPVTQALEHAAAPLAMAQTQKNQRRVVTFATNIKNPATELIIQVGDIVTVLEDDDPEDGPGRWVLGRNDTSGEGIQGWFPLFYTQPAAEEH